MGSNSMHILTGLMAASTPFVASFAPRDVTVVNGRWVNASGNVEHLRGMNVVVKGPPWLPAVDGTTHCGTTSSICTTFNEEDAAYFRSQGWNLIRLGTIWAGAQPTPSLQLDPDFVERLHKILELCHRYSIRVILDLHQDAMGTALCGEGVPMWYSQLHLAHLIGKPLVSTASPAFGKCSLTDLAGWEQHAGDPQYNILNECCTAINAPGNWGSALIPTLGVQLTFEHLVGTQVGRHAYATFVGLLTRAVANHSAAIGIELMNEPPFYPEPIQASQLFDLYRESYDAVRSVSDELAVGVADAGDVALSANDTHLPACVRDWLRNNTTRLMYNFHAYRSYLFPPFNVSVANAKALAALWGGAVPVLTEFSEADAKLADEAGVDWTIYQYNSYCSVPAQASPDPTSNCTPGDACAFGACIT